MGDGSGCVPTLYIKNLRRRKKREKNLFEGVRNFSSWRFEVRSALPCEAALTLPCADLPLEGRYESEVNQAR
jgi:hypothetical protein